MFTAQAAPPEPARAPAPPPRGDGYSERRSDSGPGFRDTYDDRPRRRDDFDRARRDDFDDDYPRERPRDVSRAWGAVRMGLNLVVIGGWLGVAMWGIIAIGAGLFLLAGVSMFDSVSNAPADRAAGRAVGGAVAMGLGMVLFAGVVGMMALGEVILRLVGYGMCMMTPSARNSAAKGLAIAAFSCACAAVFLNFVGAGLSGFAFRAGLAGLAMASFNNVFGYLSSLIAFVGFILWLIYIRSLAVQLRNSDVAGRVIVYLICYLIFMAVSFLVFVIIFFAFFASVFGAAQSAQAGSNALAGRTIGTWAIVSMILAGMIGLGWLGLQVWHVLIVTQARRVVERHLARL